MLGPIVRHIDRAGSDYQVRNASGGGGRDAPSYSDDGTIRAVLEQRNSPARTTDSSGTDIESDLEIRALTEGVTIREAGSANGYPTKLIHPNGRTYQVLASHPEDSGVTVMTVVRD
jgi:hypothetical protein